MSRLVRAGALAAIASAVLACRNARVLVRPRPSPRRAAATILIPARNEGRHIAACVRAARACAERVVVLDDGSTDATAPLAAAAGAEVVSGHPPPDGWAGKPWALEQLAAVGGDVLVFADADVRLEPGAVSALLDALGEADLASVFPRQAAHGAERLVQPLVTWTWLATLPLDLAESSARPSLTTACGQLFAIRRDALARAGGFAAVRGEVLDDLALARAVKASGGRVRVLGGRHLGTTRMYDGWAELRDGYGKSLWSAFGSPAGAAAVVLVGGMVWVLPAVAALRGSRWGAVGYAAGVASRLVSARMAGDRPLDAVAHPVSVVALGHLTLRSVVRHRRGETTWKGRPV